MRFVQPDSIRQGLKERRVISYRYLVNVDGKESYEAVLFAGVRHPEDRADHLVQALDLLKDAGIDYVGGRDAYDCLGNDMNAYAIFLCRERGMAYQAADPELLNVLPDIAHEELIRVVQKYEHRAGFYGIYLADEPVETLPFVRAVIS